MPELLLIVARDQPKLYERLCLEFNGDQELAVVMDRRVSERRTKADPVMNDQRRVDRRQSLIENQLRRLGWATARTH